MAKYTEARIEEIRGHLAELKRRGVSVAQFAEEIGVAAWTVYTWKRRFACEPRRGATTRSAKKRRADLIEIDRAAMSSAIEIVAGPMTVRVPPGCDPDDLERVLQAVRSC